ncbi:MAG: glycosyltransferase family 2 protein [Planctomycetota bacterium]|jgi:glycosyltransferase involved in cell wall biosynthesis
METKPDKTTVSIVIPNFNQEKYLGNAIDSALAQKGDFSLDIIVVDGKSTDGSVDILKKYGNKIRWISEKDSGGTEAVNKGLKMAKGSILAFIPSDDLYEQDAIQAVVDFFSSHPEKKWAYGRYRIIDRNGKEIRRFIKWYKYLLCRRYSYGKLLTENYIAGQTVFFRKEILQDIGFFNTEYDLVSDYEYWLRIGQKHPAVFIDKYIARFRVHSRAKGSMNFKRQLKDGLIIARKYADGKYKLSIVLHHINYAKIMFCYSIMRILGI